MAFRPQSVVKLVWVVNFRRDRMLIECHREGNDWHVVRRGRTQHCKTARRSAFVIILLGCLRLFRLCVLMPESHGGSVSLFRVPLILCLLLSAPLQGTDDRANGALAQQADLLYNNKQWTEAAKAYEGLVTFHPEDARSALNLADCYEQSGDFAKAISAYQAAANSPAGILTRKQEVRFRGQY